MVSGAFKSQPITCPIARYAGLSSKFLRSRLDSNPESHFRPLQLDIGGVAESNLNMKVIDW